MRQCGLRLSTNPLGTVRPNPPLGPLGACNVNGLRLFHALCIALRALASSAKVALMRFQQDKKFIFQLRAFKLFILEV